MAPEAKSLVTDDIAEQRKFIHDVAGALAVAIFLGDSLIRTAKKAPESTDPATLEKLERLAQALDKCKVLLQDRRNVLISRSGPSNP
jgi:hypothetical protein